MRLPNHRLAAEATTADAKIETASVWQHPTRELRVLGTRSEGAVVWHKVATAALNFSGKVKQ